MAVNSTSDDATSCRDVNFEESLAELEAVVRDLEEGQLGLSEALGRYEQGVNHLKNCYRLLQAAERKIELLTGVAEDGTPSTTPFDEGTEPLAKSAGRRRRGGSAGARAIGDVGDRDIDA